MSFCYIDVLISLFLSLYVFEMVAKIVGLGLSKVSTNFLHSKILSIN